MAIGIAILSTLVKSANQVSVIIFNVFSPGQLPLPPTIDAPPVGLGGVACGVVPVVCADIVGLVDTGGIEPTVMMPGAVTMLTVEATPHANALALLLNVYVTHSGEEPALPVTY